MEFASITFYWLSHQYLMANTFQFYDDTVHSPKTIKQRIRNGSLEVINIYP